MRAKSIRYRLTALTLAAVMFAGICPAVSLTAHAEEAGLEAAAEEAEPVIAEAGEEETEDAGGVIVPIAGGAVIQEEEIILGLPVTGQAVYDVRECFDSVSGNLQLGSAYVHYYDSMMNPLYMDHVFTAGERIRIYVEMTPLNDLTFDKNSQIIIHRQLLEQLIGVDCMKVSYINGEKGTLDISWTVPFRDVLDPDTFYYDAINWIALSGITTGWDDGTFRPLNSCNRAAVVTFLYRMAGKPPVPMSTGGMPFSDMTGNEEFDRAILWAVDKGITSGFDDGTFRPWSACNRAAILTFLWRYAGRPTELGPETSSFPDMTGNSDFDAAIRWAASWGIVTGYDDGTMRPWNTCNRLQVACFLYRY